jgi:hypothetical protein
MRESNVWEPIRHFLVSCHGKHIYEDESAARAAAVHMTLREREQFRAYRCEQSHWHIGRVSKERT